MPSPATSSTSTPSGLSSPPMPVPAKLAAAWTSFMFLYIYVDYFSLYKPGFLDQMRAGRVHEFDISVISSPTRAQRGSTATSGM